MKKIIFTLIVLATLVACQKNEPDSLFDKNPSERFEESQAELLSKAGNLPILLKKAYLVATIF